MMSSTRSLVHRLVAARLHLDDASIKDADHFDELGPTPLDVVLVVLRLDRLRPGDGDFPVYALDYATTVGDLVVVVEVWLQGGFLCHDVAPRERIES